MGKIVGVVQARTGSTRLPRKVLLEVEGYSAIELLFSRVKQSVFVDEWWLATTELDEDVVLSIVAKLSGLKVYKGSEENVHNRFCQIAYLSEADYLVRITGDCPFMDPMVIDYVVCTPGEWDYCSNIRPVRTFPDGLDVEVFSRRKLFSTANSSSPEVQEHVTPGMYNEADSHCVESVADFSHLRWTLDYREDWNLIKTCWKYFLPRRDFSWLEVLAWQTKYYPMSLWR